MPTYRIKPNARRRHAAVSEYRWGKTFTTDRDPFSVVNQDGDGDFMVALDEWTVHDSRMYILPEFIELVSEPATASDQSETSPEQLLIKQQQEEMRRLQDLLKNVRDELILSRQNHERDITLIGEHLMQTAEDKGYCEDYDEMVNEINAKLGSYELPTRMVEMIVTVTFTQEIRVEVPRSQYDMKDAAEEAARESDEYGDINGSDESDISVREASDY